MGYKSCEYEHVLARQALIDMASTRVAQALRRCSHRFDSRSATLRVSSDLVTKAQIPAQAQDGLSTDLIVHLAAR